MLRENADPHLISSYTEDGLKSIIDVLGQEDPDIITLQETHVNEEFAQPEAIADALDMGNVLNDSWNESHLEAGQFIGQAILSKYPMEISQGVLFKNPGWETEWEDGSIVRPHEKGLTGALVKIDEGSPLLTQTLHLIPFRRFNINNPLTEAPEVLADVDNTIGDYSGRRLIQGDFNIDSFSLKDYFPGLFASGVKEIEQYEGTTPKGRRLDHVLYSGMVVVKSTVIKPILTDHYPIVTTFEL